MGIKELGKRRDSWARHVKYRQASMQNFMNAVIVTFEQQQSEINDLRKKISRKK